MFMSYNKTKIKSNQILSWEGKEWEGERGGAVLTSTPTSDAYESHMDPGN